jgi:hypothetical protein
LAADSVAPLDGYIKAIRRLITVGYRHAGFPNVEVSVNADAKEHTVVVDVKEGPRYITGEIRFHGVKTLPIAELTARLTQRYPPKDAIAQSFYVRQGEAVTSWVDSDAKAVELSEPVWCIGKPAPFPAVAKPASPESAFDLHQEVKDALADLGYFFTHSSVDVVPDQVAKKAHLVIDIKDEGIRSLFSSVTLCPAAIASNSVNVL